MEPSPPKVAAAIWAITVRWGSVSQSPKPSRSQAFSTYLTSASRASAVTPANIAAAMPPISASVVAAFRLLGGRNAGTPLAIASTPVSAVHPEAKARSAKNTSASPVSWAYSGSGVTE